MLTLDEHAYLLNEEEEESDLSTTVGEYVLLRTDVLPHVRTRNLILSAQGVPVPTFLDDFCEEINTFPEWGDDDEVTMSFECKQEVLKKLDNLLRDDGIKNIRKAVMFQALLLLVVHTIRSFPANLRQQRADIIEAFLSWHRTEANVEEQSFYELAMDCNSHINWFVFS